MPFCRRPRGWADVHSGRAAAAGFRVQVALRLMFCVYIQGPDRRSGPFKPEV